MSYLDTLNQQTNKQQTRTENGAVTNQSTLNPLLDFFSRAGAMRDNKDEALQLFNKAFAEDPQGAIRCLFYLRNVRGGQGERDIFRHILSELDQKTFDKIVKFIPEYGRWDEVPYDGSGLELIKSQLEKDEKAMKANKSISLLAKWLPSENASSRVSRAQAITLAKNLGLKPSAYRKKIVPLRKHISLLEQKMSSKQWPEIEYDKIPSQAHRKHVKAFRRHDEERYEGFLGQVESGEKKLKTDTLFTYEIFDTIQHDEKAANAMWESLPDFTRGENALVIADVSGSMYGRPISISVSLALYFAEHNKGAFHNYFMTFSEVPQLVKVIGNTLAQKLQNIENANWDMDTNVEAAFKAILSAAQESKANADEMPRILYIISDMEFNTCVEDASLTNFENAKRMFEEAGYTLPHVVFWNVDARNNQSPATKFDNNVTLISGSSQSTFRYALEGKTPEESMMDILNSERYAQIKI